MLMFSILAIPYVLNGIPYVLNGIPMVQDPDTVVEKRRKKRSTPLPSAGVAVLEAQWPLAKS